MDVVLGKIDQYQDGSALTDLKLGRKGEGAESVKIATNNISLDNNGSSSIDSAKLKDDSTVKSTTSQENSSPTSSDQAKALEEREKAKKKKEEKEKNKIVTHKGKNSEAKITLNNSIIQYKIEQHEDKETHEKSKDLVVYLLEKKTHKVIRKIPPDEFYDPYKKNIPTQGIFFDQPM